MRITFLLTFSFACLLFSSCSENSVEVVNKTNSLPGTDKEPMRVGMVTGIKPDKIGYYKELHANTWPGVLKKINECNIRNYSIYIKQKVRHKSSKGILCSWFAPTDVINERERHVITGCLIVTRSWWALLFPCLERKEANQRTLSLQLS